MTDMINIFNICHHFYADDSQLLAYTNPTPVPQHRRQLNLYVERLKRQVFLATSVELVQVHIRQSLSCSAPNQSLPTSNISTWTSTSVLSSLNRICPWHESRPRRWTIEAPARQQIVIKLLFSPPPPVPVLVDVRSVIVTTPRFSIHHFPHWLPQRGARWPSILHACTAPRTERVSSLVCWRVITSPTSCGRYNSYRSPIGFATSCLVMYAVYNVTSPSYRHNYQNLDASWRRSAAIRQDKRVWHISHQNKTRREPSLW